MPEIPTILAASELNIWSLIAEAHWVVKLVMILLVGMSLVVAVLTMVGILIMVFLSPSTLIPARFLP